MPNFYQGDIVRDYWTVLNESGTQVSGVTWTILETVDPDEEDFSLTITDLGDGLYRGSFLADKVGTYYFLVQTTNLSPEAEQTFEGEITVDAASVGGAVIGVEAHGLTLNDLIQMCAVTVGDFLWTQATTNGAADGTSFVDQQRLAAIPSQSLNGSSITVVSPEDSANYLAERRVYLSDEATQTLTITPAFPAQVLSGTEAWITNLESKGFWRQQYVNAINNAIRLSYPMHLVPLEYTYPGTFDYLDPTIPTPSQLTHLWGVSWYDPYTPRWNPMSMSPSNVPGSAYGWWFDYSTGAVGVGYKDAEALNAYSMKLHGYGRPAPLVEADDITTVNANWIVNRVAEMLLDSKGDQRKLANAARFENKAELYIGLNVTQVQPGTIKIK